MASLNQLTSEIAHAVGDPNNVPLRRNIRYAIIHTRNELIRKSFENHKFIDKGLLQRFKATIIDVPDGDLYNSQDLNLPAIKRTEQKVPKPVRLSNGVPFQSVRTAGVMNAEIAFAKEASAQFYHYLAGFCNMPIYDYINGYIYFFSSDINWFKNIDNIIIESPFEYPYIITEETIEKQKEIHNPDDEEYNIEDDEFLLPEDMIGAIKDIIFKRNLLDVHRDSNEASVTNLVNS